MKVFIAKDLKKLRDRTNRHFGLTTNSILCFKSLSKQAEVLAGSDIGIIKDKECNETANFLKGIAFSSGVPLVIIRNGTSDEILDFNYVDNEDEAYKSILKHHGVHLAMPLNRLESYAKYTE